MTSHVDAVEKAVERSEKIEQAARWLVAVLKRIHTGVSAGMLTDEEERIYQQGLDDALAKLDTALGGVADAPLEEIRSVLREQ